MKDYLGGILMLTFFIVMIFALGIVAGSDYQKRYTSVGILNGTAEYKLIEQDDHTVKWMKTEPYTIDCVPTKYNKDE